MDVSSNKLHYIAVTCIIERDGKFLICKRSEKEKAFPSKWCVPGGKVETQDFINLPKDTSSHWLDVFERVLKKEIREEVNLEIKEIDYVSNLAFVRPNGCSTIIISMFARYDFGNVRLSEDELTDYAWVDLEEAKDYDLIENIYEQLVFAKKKFG